MSIDRSIFDKYQKTLINSKYITLEQRDNIIYADNDSEIVKPMTAEEYRELGLPVVDKELNSDELLSSTGLIENIFGTTAQTATSFATTLNFFKDQMTQNDFKSIIDKDEGLTFIETFISESIGNISTTDANFELIFNKLANLVEFIPSITSMILSTATALLEVSAIGVNTLSGGLAGVGMSAFSLVKNVFFTKGNSLEDVFRKVGEDFKVGYDAGSSFISSITTPVIGVLNSVITMGQSAIVNYSSWLTNTLNLMSDTFTNVYKDGVSETKFGEKMEATWREFVKNNQNSIVFSNKNNPVSNLGTSPILFGAPPRYVSLSDPRDRSYINTFIKDGNILSIIPGKPKYNGLSLGKINRDRQTEIQGANFDNMNITASNLSSFFKSWGSQTTANDVTSEVGYQTTAQEYASIALDYLKRNGISNIFNQNDKRYYTFEPDYENYYSYLETMLNTIYTRMGLGEMGDNRNEMFSFFENQGTEQETLMEKFNGRSIGFYFEGNPSIAENMSNDTNDPAGLKSTADSMSDEFQRYNYISGFGIKSSRKAGIASARITKAVDIAGQIIGGVNEKSPFSALTSKMKTGLLSGMANIGDKMLGALSFTAGNDLSVITESMLSTNGMKTEFPNLWTDSNYSKSINVDFEFISPYGDPLSIFQYCYVPLCAILALALPKQAEENGYVNPFFLRMDIPGVISSDFAIISNITWVRGGVNNLWTVDKHPRAISVSVTFEDLYQFLAMTKRISFLSANPNFSMFLDSFSGIRSLHEGNSINGDYWNLMVNRLNSNVTVPGEMWNKNSVDTSINQYFNQLTDDPIEKQFFNNYYKRDVSWMKSK